MISKSMKYEIRKESENGTKEEIDVSSYLSQLFSNHYSEFLMNFEMETLLNSIAD